MRKFFGSTGSVSRVTIESPTGEMQSSESVWTK